jgi:hypothetical protein
MFCCVVDTNLQTRENLSDHGAIEGVELLGSIELNAAKTVNRVEQDVIGFVSGELFDGVC